MAQTSWPFENIDTSEAQYSQLFSEFQTSGVSGDYTSATTIAVTAPSGMNLVVSDGFAIVRGFAYYNSSDLTLVADPATAQPRIDTVILRLDPTVNSVVAAIKKGTPGASPSAPALTQTPDAVYEMPLANILVPASATALDPANLTDRRRFLGSQVGVWRTNSRPETPRHGQMGLNLTTAKFEFYNAATPGWTSTFPLDVVLGDGSITDAKLAIPPRRYLSVDVMAGSATINVIPSMAGKFIEAEFGSTITVNVTETSLSAAGDRVDFIQDSTGQLNFVADGTTTINSKNSFRRTAGIWSAVSLVKTTSGQYRLIGDLVA